MRFPLKLVDWINCYLFGLISCDDVGDVATKALSEGVDTPSLRVLAGLNSATLDPREVRRLVESLISELKIKISSTQEAGWGLIELYIDAIIDGTISFEEGLEPICHTIYHSMEWPKDQKMKFALEPAGLHTLYGLYDTYIDLDSAQIPWDKDKTNEELKQELGKTIIEECRKYKSEVLERRKNP